MVNITVFITSWCPHCKRALAWIEEIIDENPEYKDIKVEIIDEEKQPEIAKKYDYYYVPTYFIGEDKIYEGGTTKETVEKVFKVAYDSIN